MFPFCFSPPPPPSPPINHMTTTQPILSFCPCCGGSHGENDVNRPFGRNFIRMVTTAFPETEKDFTKHKIGLKDDYGFRVCGSCYNHGSRMAKVVRESHPGFEHTTTAKGKVLVITTPILTPPEPLDLLREGN
mmetsp:Transcript_19908/g.25974  ORF Transcript_19908/g.25974 Transcript_19908/m.25974 type:complete len:133 (+) Transcript_19908:95-493(+)